MSGEITMEDWQKILNPRCITCRKILPVGYENWKCEECRND